MDYATWKDHAASTLAVRHGIRSNRIPEREWKRLYIIKSSPEEAAAQAHNFYLNTRPAAERTHHRREISKTRMAQTPRERLHDTITKKKPGRATVLETSARPPRAGRQQRDRHG